MRITPVHRRGRGLLTTAAATFALLLTAGTAHADLGDGELRAVTDEYLFEISLDEFVSTRADRPHDDQLDWSADACSWSPDEPLGYEFTSSCYRHDFGYRNYQVQERFTEPNRLRIDDNFKADMYSTCDGNSTCEGVANLYYFAVREFGGGGVSTAEAVEKADITVEKSRSGKPVAMHATGRDGRVVEVPTGG